MTRTDEQRRRAVEYLNAHPEQREKARIRARAAMDRKRMSDPVQRRKLDIYAQLVELQGGEHCAICKVPRKPDEKRLAIDHDWETDEIRGLLCTRCNGAIGRTREVSSWLHNAIEYLDREHYTGISYEPIRTAVNAEYAHLRDVDEAAGDALVRDGMRTA